MSCFLPLDQAAIRLHAKAKGLATPSPGRANAALNLLELVESSHDGGYDEPACAAASPSRRIRRVGSVVSVHGPETSERVEGAGAAAPEPHAPMDKDEPGLGRPDGLAATVDALCKLFGPRGEFVVDTCELVREHGFESALLIAALDLLRGASVVLLDPVSGYDVWEGPANAGRSDAGQSSEPCSEREKLSRALCKFWCNSPVAGAGVKSGGGGGGGGGSSSSSSSSSNNSSSSSSHNSDINSDISSDINIDSDKTSGSRPQRFPAKSVMSALEAAQATMDVTLAQVEAVVEALCSAGVLRGSSGRRYSWNETAAPPEQQEVDPLPAPPAAPSIARVAPSRVRVSAVPCGSASSSPERQWHLPKHEQGPAGRMGAGKAAPDSPARMLEREQAQHNGEVLEGLMESYTAAVLRPPPRAGSLALSQDCNSQDTDSGGTFSGPAALEDGGSATDQEEQEQEQEGEGDNEAAGSATGPARAAASLAAQSGLLRSDTLESLRMVPIEIADSDVQQLLDFAGQRA